MKKSASPKSSRNQTSNHYHPSSEMMGGLFGFFGKILLGMLSPITDGLRCLTGHHDPEPHYHAGKYSTHTHRCSRCHTILGMGRMNWPSIPPSEKWGISPVEWNLSPVGCDEFDDLRAYSKKEYEETCKGMATVRASMIVMEKKAFEKRLIANEKIFCIRKQRSAPFEAGGTSVRPRADRGI